ncbi:MAG: DUF2867 domain-containing protein [Acidobacteriota bacterium]
MKVLVTGATGYIGGRLIPNLLEAGHQIRIIVRDPKRVIGRPWEKSVEVTRGDLTDLNSLRPALDGIDCAYYLVHSMYAGVDFVNQDRLAVKNFIQAGKHLKHVIYLGGLLPEATTMSRHLQSRAEVGETLRESLPTTEIRAGPIIGSGSASFELVRYVTQRFPLIVAPYWIRNEVQPIAIRDILQYLCLALLRDPLGIVDVGSGRLTFRQMMEEYALEQGLVKRWILCVPPFLPPRYVVYWFGLLTPVTRALALPIIESITHPVIADCSKARTVFPEVQPISYRQAVQLALERIDRNEVQTIWSGAIGHLPTYELIDSEGLIREIRTLYSDCSPEAVFRSFSSIGGDRGWLVWEWVWEIRGLIDKVVGGPGLRRGRRHPTEILSGEALDFWRVEAIVPPRMLLLRAEMKLPGRAWFQWEAIPEGKGTRLIQTAMYDPKGFLGTIYWYSLYPIHRLIFSDLIEAISLDASKYEND